MRRDAKTDANQGEIVRAFEKCGAVVLSLAAMGRGVPDLLVSINNRLRLVEVKSAKGKLRPKQIEFAQRWPVEIARNVSDVERIVRADRLSDYPSNGKDDLPGWK